MKSIILPAAFGLVFGLASCQTTQPEQTADAPVASVPSVKPYPLTTCLVTDEDLDSMGGAVTRVHNGQEVKFCCKSCVRKFEADSDKYLAKLK